MAVNLSIKGVPDEIAERLRERAARNHRSLQGELMAIVSQAAAEASEETALGGAGKAGPIAGAGPAPVMSGRQSFRRGTMTVDEVLAKIREVFPTPPTGLPDSVDIIREARDSR
jgi:plasmid stability protein